MPWTHFYAAIDEAKKGLSEGGLPIGSVLGAQQADHRQRT